MRFMMLVKADAEYEAGKPPSPELMAELAKNMPGGGGLPPTMPGLPPKFPGVPGGLPGLGGFPGLGKKK